MNKKKSIPSWIKLTFSIVIIFILILIQAGVFTPGKIAPGQKNDYKLGLPEKYSVVNAEKIKIDRSFEESGIVTTDLKATISPQVMGIIEKINVQPGEKVKKGDILLVINSDQFKMKLGQAEKGMEQAKAGKMQAEQHLLAATAAYEQARKGYYRTKSYFEKKAASEVQLEAAESGFKQAKAAMKAAREGVEAAKSGVEKAQKYIDEAKIAIGYSKIKAPFDGVITQKYVDAGDMASPGRPVFTINNPKVYQLKANIRESLMPFVSIGQKLKINIGSKSYLGTVSEVTPNIDPATRTFPVKVTFKPVEKIFVGMYGKLLVPAGESLVVAIPKNAVYSTGQLKSVLIKQDDYCKRVYIQTGEIIDANMIEVLSGLSGVEKLIVTE